MSVRADKINPARKMQVEQVVVGFDGEKLKAPFLLRCGALMIDYILMATIPVASLLLGRFVGNDGAKLLNSEISNVGWLITLLLGLTNFVIFPMFGGQSLGKMFTGLRIAKLDGTAPGFGNVLVRNLLGYPITLLTGGLGFLISAVTSNGRALHDYIAGTVVVYGQKSVSKKSPARKSGKKK